MKSNKDRMRWEIEKRLAENEYIDKKKFMSWVRWNFGCSTEKAKTVIKDLENLDYLKSVGDSWASIKYEGNKLDCDIVTVGKKRKEREDGKTKKI